MNRTGRHRIFATGASDDTTGTKSAWCFAEVSRLATFGPRLTYAQHPWLGARKHTNKVGELTAIAELLVSLAHDPPSFNVVFTDSRSALKSVMGLT